MDKNIRDMSITMLKEVAKNNKFDRTKMAAICGVSVETWDRWMNDKGFTRSANTLNQINEVIKKYHKAS